MGGRSSVDASVTIAAFYKNEIESTPDGDFIENMLREWYGNYDRLEYHHGACVFCSKCNKASAYLLERRRFRAMALPDAYIFSVVRACAVLCEWMCVSILF